MNENYYLLLNLSIEQFVSGQKAVEALEKQVKVWKASNNTDERNKAEKYEKPIREAIANAAVWETQYEAAKKFVTEALETWIMVVRGKGYITENEITEKAKALSIPKCQIKGYKVSEAFVKKMITDKNIRISEGDAAATATQEVKQVKLEDYKSKGDNKFKQPTKSVAQLGCTDFYDVLKKYQKGTEQVFTFETEAEICVAAAKEIEKAWKAKKENAEKSALQTVCTAIIGHFAVKDDIQNQQEYNKFLLYTRIKAILDELKGNFKGAQIKIIDEVTKGHYTNRIMELISDSEIAEGLLASFCKDNGITAPQRMPQMGMCPFCHNTFEKKGGELPDVCPVCAKSFLLKCPKCSKSVNYARDRKCKCGFNLEIYPRLEKKCEEAKRYISTLNFDFAKFSISEVEAAWSSFPGLDELKKDLKSKNDKLGMLVKSMRKCIDEHNFMSAKKEYLNLQTLIPGYTDIVLSDQIEGALKEAASCYQSAKTAKDNNTKLQYLIKATEIVADYADALRELGSIAPEPVQKLECESVQNAGYVNLKWKSDNQDGTAIYVILRKSHSKPMSAEDGKLAQTNEKAFCDNTLKPGIPYFYSAYAIRGNNKTALKHAEAPVIIFPEIKNPNIIPDEKSIQVTWKTDVGDMSVEVFRCTSAAMKKYGEGTKISSVTKNSFEDGGLSLGNTYYYNIFLTTKVEGKQLVSAPLSLSASPVKISKPMKYELIQKDDIFSITLATKPESDEKIEFYFAEKSIVVPGDGVVAKNRLITEFHLTPLKVTKENEQKYTFKPAKNAKGYIYVVSVRGDTAVIGQEEYFEKLEMLAAKSIRCDGVKLHIELVKWPAEINIMTIAYRTDRFPTSPNEQGSLKFQVNALQYKSQNISMDFEAEKCYYIVGFVRGGNGYIPVFREKYGEEKRIKIEYYFKKGLWGPRKLIISLSEPSDLPEMVLQCKPLYFPAGKQDGKELAKISSSEKKKQFKIPLPDLPFKGNGDVYGKLFLEDDALQERYQLMIAEGHTPKL